MSRPTQCRNIAVYPNATSFRPSDIPYDAANELSMPLDELEALRLADMEEMTAIEAARHMNVSRHTFGRILSHARKTVATALCSGYALKIEGGHYSLANLIPAPAGFSGRIAVCATGPAGNAAVSERFGRAGGFVIVDVPSMEFSYLDTGRLQDGEQEAGLATVRLLGDANVTVVLGKIMGPKVFAALQAKGIRICLNCEGTVLRAVELFCTGKLPDAVRANWEPDADI